MKNKYTFDLRLIRDERCCIENPFGRNKVYLGNENVLFAGEVASLVECWGIGTTSALLSGENAAHAIKEKNNMFKCYKGLMVDKLRIIEESFKRPV